MSMSDNPEALRRLWPIIEKALGGLVFTADKAGEVAADVATVRDALAQQAATPMTAEQVSDKDAMDLILKHAVPGVSVVPDPRAVELGLVARPAATPAPAEPVALERYDAGLLNDYGGGNVEWWQDYLRAELDRAHDFYASQIAAPPATPAAQPADERDDDALTVAYMAGRYDGRKAATAAQPAELAAYITMLERSKSMFLGDGIECRLSRETLLRLLKGNA